MQGCNSACDLRTGRGTPKPFLPKLFPKVVAPIATYSHSLRLKHPLLPLPGDPGTRKLQYHLPRDCTVRDASL